MSTSVEQPVDFNPFSGPELALTHPTTEAQREVYAAAGWGKAASCAFNESFSLHLSGNLDRTLLATAVTALVARHEALRSAFTPDGETVCVAVPGPVDLPYVEADRTRLGALLAAEVETPFDLVRGPLYRFRLVRLGADDHVLIFCAHHLVCDGWSTAILVKDLGALYSGMELGEAARYADYAAWEAERRQSGEAAADEAYWLGLFKDGDAPVPVLDLPLDAPRPVVKTYASRRLDLELPPELLKRLKAVGAKSQASLFAVLTAGFYVWLQRLTGQERFVLGVPAAGQSVKGEDALVGHCVNLLPVPCAVDTRQPFTTLLKTVRAQVLDAYDHQQFTFGSLLKKLQVERDPSRLPLVSVMFNLDQGLSENALRFKGLKARFATTPRHFENFELFLNLIEIAGQTTLECQYNADLFSEGGIRAKLEAYVELLRSIAEAPESAVGRLNLLTAAERQRLAAWNATATPPPAVPTLHGLIERRAAASPSAPAVVQGDVVLKYGELNARANKLARHLASLGVRPGAMVGVALDRTPELLVGLLGILKAGAAYVPVDPGFPAERLTAMFEDSALQVLVTTAEVAESLPTRPARLVCLDTDQAALARHDAQNPGLAVGADDIAYVIFTSGSTGRPKGVLVPHGAVANFLESMAREPGLTAEDKLLAVTTISFDIHVLELYLPLVQGGQVWIATRSEAGDANLLKELTYRSRATVMQATPSTWRMLIDAGWRGTPALKALCGGEALPRDLLGPLLGRVGSLWNMYGPTETTVWSTCAPVKDPAKPVLVGRPIANTTVYVVDPELNPVPQGVAGELLIGGTGVAKGYLNRPDLTAEKFVIDTHSTRPGARLYRTGDLARFTADGALECLGRTDHQVKVRGFRIELGEIEAALARHPAVASAVAGVRERQPGDPRLVAWFVPRVRGAASAAELRASLKGILPEYMMPQLYLEVDVLPLTPNGKIDRKRLPSPFTAGAAAVEGYVAPTTPRERELVAFAGTLLGRTQVSITADLFVLGLDEAGAETLAKQAGVPVRDIFTAKTIKTLAGGKTAVRAANVPGAGSPAAAGVPVSEVQQRILALEAAVPGTSLNNLPTAFRIFGAFDEQAMARAIASLIERHATLRTSFRDGLQHVAASVPLPLIREDYTRLSKDEREANVSADMAALCEKPFDLTKAPLFQVKTYRMAPDETVLFMQAHHAVWDGWSFDLFLKELADLYSGTQLPALPLQFTDVCAVTEPDPAQLAYWRKQLAAPPAPLDLPTDRPRPSRTTYKGRSTSYYMPRDLANALTAVGREQGATLFMVLLAAYKVLLFRLSGAAEQLIATPVRGRPDAATEAMIGAFVNQIALRTRVDATLPFHAYLKQVRQVALEGYGHDGVPFGRLAAELKVEPRAAFSFQDARERRQSLGALPFQQINVEPTACAVDLNFWVKESHDALMGSMNYSTDLFDEATVKALMAAYNALLYAIVQNPATPVGDLALALGDAAVLGVRAWLEAVPKVEEQLAAHPAVQRGAVTVLPGGDGAARLVAFYAVKPAEYLTATDLRKHLRATLPEALVPQQLVEIEQVPVLASGKVDKLKLAAGLQPSASDADEGFVQPSSPAELALAQVWKELLGVDSVSAAANFFEVGGHSLLAIQMIARVETATGIKLGRMAVTLNTLGQIAATMSMGGEAVPATLPAADDKQAGAPAGGGIAHLLGRFRRGAAT